MVATSDMVGKRFGRLVVLRQGVRSKQYITWICQCDCGLIVEVRGVSLRNGHTQSCGCLNREKVSANLKNYKRKVASDGCID